MILLDTDICIEILRGNKKVLKKSNAHEGDLAISFITIAELFYGAYKSNFIAENISLIENFNLTVQVFQSDNNIMRKFGELKAGLKKQNNLLADADIIIAATAIKYCDKLISGNVKHFSRIESLTIENWKN